MVGLVAGNWGFLMRWSSVGWCVGGGWEVKCMAVMRMNEML